MLYALHLDALRFSVARRVRVSQLPEGNRGFFGSLARRTNLGALLFREESHRPSAQERPVRDEYDREPQTEQECEGAAKIDVYGLGDRRGRVAQHHIPPGRRLEGGDSGAAGGVAFGAMGLPFASFRLNLPKRQMRIATPRRRGPKARSQARRLADPRRGGPGRSAQATSGAIEPQSAR